MPEMGKESNSSVCHENPFTTPSGVNPAPLTRTWRGTHTTLDVCAAERFSALFFVVKSIFHTVYGCSLGRSAEGDMLYIIPISQFEILLPTSLQRKTYFQERR